MPSVKLKVQGTDIQITKDEYISLTDIAKYKNKKHPDDIIKNWIRNKNTIEFLGLWEKINNERFKPVEFDRFRIKAGTNSFVLRPKRWIERTNAVGLRSKSGRYGGTYAHRDIAFEFASWISSEFKLYLIKEFERLKTKEGERLSQEWNLTRTLSKINYKIHTDSIKENLIPKELSKKQIFLVYANEADVLNMALFNKTAKQWRDQNQDKDGNIRDYANIKQLICLSNLESINAELIREGLSQKDRLKKLNSIAIIQMKSLVINKGILK
jgi:hypothetical protein